MMVLTLVSRLQHSTAASSSTNEEKKKKQNGGGNTTNGHTRQPSFPSFMSWRERHELDYSNPPAVPHGYGANSPNLESAGSQAFQPRDDYRYPLAIAEDDVSDPSIYHDQDHDYGYGQGQGR